MKHLFFLLFFTLLLIGSTKSQIPLPNAHSHNDYDQQKPLKGALAYGFTSIEADVLYIYGKLYVGHNMPDKKRHKLKTLTRQYLRPLYKRFKANQGSIYPGYDGVFYLWIDIKFESAKAYKRLKEVLYPYREMLNYYENGQFHQGKITVILSGARPFKELLEDDLQLMTLDGRPEDLKFNYPSYLMPFISENAGKVCGISDYSEFGPNAISRIHEFVQNAKAQNKKTRLWATPEEESLWDILLQAKIDLINTDDLSRLQYYFLGK